MGHVHSLPPLSLSAFHSFITVFFFFSFDLEYLLSNWLVALCLKFVEKTKAFFFVKSRQLKVM